MPRTLSEQEFEAVKAKVLSDAPPKLSEDEFTRYISSAMPRAVGEAEASNQTPDGGATGRYLGGLAKNLNPITMVQGAYNAVRHPIDTAGSIVQSQFAELKKAADNFQQGRYSEAAGHGAAGLLPVVGPAAAAAGERIASGDVAGGLGEGTGLIAPFSAGAAVSGAKTAARGAVAAARTVPAGADALDAMAALADRASTNRMVDVAGPKVGPNKLRLNNRLAKVAPDLARDPDLSALSRQGLQAKVAAKLEDATAALDEAAANRNPGAAIETKPILDALMAKRAKLAAEPVEGSRMVPSVTGDPVREIPANPTRQYALAWIKDDMDNLPFTKHTWNDLSHETGKRGNAGGGGLELVPGSAGAPIYQAIVGGDFKATRGQVIQAINDVMKGRTDGPLRQRIISVADDLANGDRATQKLMATSGPNVTPDMMASRITDLKGKPADMPALSGRPIGAPVTPSPNASRLAPIEQAIAEVQQLGPVARYESLRRIRQAYDEPAKAVYSPSMTADYLAKKGESMGAADVTSALRDSLATMDPSTAAANAQYSLYKTAHDVLQATEETQRARPRVLRGIVARTGGAMVGAESGGMVGAGVGVILGSVVERAAELAPTLKIVVARQLASVADLLRGGNVAQAESTLRKIGSRLPAKMAGPFGQESVAGSPQVPQEPRAANR